MVERNALEQSLMADDDEYSDDHARYLNLEGDDDGEWLIICFLSLS